LKFMGYASPAGRRAIATKRRVETDMRVNAEAAT
jgi:hypothetical protein